MFDEGIVIGRVVGRDKAGPNSEYLIVEDRSRPQYPNKVACELYGEKNRALFSKVGLGELARVTGSIRSFKSENNGRWYTTFSVFGVTNLAHLDSSLAWPPAAQPGKHQERPAEREPGSDDDVF